MTRSVCLSVGWMVGLSLFPKSARNYTSMLPSENLLLLVFSMHVLVKFLNFRRETTSHRRTEGEATVLPPPPLGNFIKRNYFSQYSTPLLSLHPPPF